MNLRYKLLLAMVLPLGALMCNASAAQTETTSANHTIELWPQGAPGALGTADTDKPTLSIYLPKTNPTQTGILVFPGGGYSHLAMAKEGSDIAAWLNARGIAAFVLKYRLGPRYHNPIEIGDAKRAIRYVRAHVQEFGIQPDRVGVWGFSAGGHLAATLGTHFDAGDAAASEQIDRESSRPDFLVLAYPVITMKEGITHEWSRRMLLGDSPSEKLVDEMSNELHVTKDTPPTFLYATTSDPAVPVMNSVMFYSALVKAGVPAELHLFEKGPHGTGLAQSFPELRYWPELLEHWMQLNGWEATPGNAGTAK
ncbi:MAG: alpha/beta hydrolase [Acidobacteriaceae bacterium]